MLRFLSAGDDMTDLSAQAFMNGGTLTQAQGQALLDAAQAIRMMIPCN